MRIFLSSFYILLSYTHIILQINSISLKFMITKSFLIQQCAAVKTKFLWITVPPQRLARLLSFVKNSRRTIHSQESWTAIPLTTRRLLDLTILEFSSIEQYWRSKQKYSISSWITPYMTFTFGYFVWKWLKTIIIDILTFFFFIFMSIASILLRANTSSWRSTCSQTFSPFRPCS